MRAKYHMFRKRDFIQVIIEAAIKYNNFRDSRRFRIHYKKILELYLDYFREAIIRGYPVEIPNIGTFKMFSVKHLDPGEKTIIKRSIQDPSVGFLLMGRGPAFRKYKTASFMSHKFSNEFYSRYGDTDMFHELMGKDGKNKFREGYY